MINILNAESHIHTPEWIFHSNICLLGELPPDLPPGQVVTLIPLEDGEHEEELTIRMTEKLTLNRGAENHVFFPVQVLGEDDPYGGVEVLHTYMVVYRLDDPSGTRELLRHVRQWDCLYEAVGLDPHPAFELTLEEMYANQREMRSHMMACYTRDEVLSTLDQLGQCLPQESELLTEMKAAFPEEAFTWN